MAAGKAAAKAELRRRFGLSTEVRACRCAFKLDHLLHLAGGDGMESKGCRALLWVMGWNEMI